MRSKNALNSELCDICGEELRSGESLICNDCRDELKNEDIEIEEESA